jgi:hypothetical protein
VILRRLINFSTKNAIGLTMEQWELAQDNVDIGGCAIDNPMDVVNATITNKEEEQEAVKDIIDNEDSSIYFTI